MAAGTIPQTMQSLGLPTAITLTSANDLDTLLTTGWYAWGASNPSNIPVNVSYCSLIVEAVGANTRQTVFRANYGNPAAPAEWTRYKFATGTWSAWTKTV